MRYYDARAELWAPLGYDRAGDSSCHSCRHLRGFGRLKRGVTLDQAAAELNAVREQVQQEHPSQTRRGIDRPRAAAARA